MKLNDFVTKEMQKYDLPDAWLHEVQLIAEGKASADSAKQRGVGLDAVKMQRKKIFKKLDVDDGRQILVNLLRTAVSRL